MSQPRPFFFSSRRRHTRCSRDWSSDVCSSDLLIERRAATTLDDVDAHVFPVTLDAEGVVRAFGPRRGFAAPPLECARKLPERVQLTRIGDVLSRGGRKKRRIKFFDCLMAQVRRNAHPLGAGVVRLDHEIVGAYIE